MIAYRCDHCLDEIGSIIRITVEAAGSDEPEHFCSISCLSAWATTNRVDAPTEPAQSEPEPVAPKPRDRDTVTHTCDLCGRVGTRRFIQGGAPDGTGWKCSPTATACIGNQPEPVRKVPNPALLKDLDAPATTSDIPAKPIPPKVIPITREPEPAPRIPHSDSPAVTARCEDCTRVFTLTGRVLEQAVELHELGHGHIVKVLEGVDA